MAKIQFLAVIFCVASVLASPRNLLPRKQKRDPGSGGGSGPPGHPHDDTWVSKSNDGPSQYDGSWDHGSSSDIPKSQHGGGDDGWGHSSTCAASTITQTLFSTLVGPASTVYVSESGYTSFLPASTVYISGSDHTSFLPASTVTIHGSAQTSFATAYETWTRPAAPTTVYVTRFRSGWNHTVTREETDVVTTTQHDYSTIHNEETTTVTSAINLPGTTTTVYQTSTSDVTVTSVSTAPGTTVTEKSTERQTEYATLTVTLPGTTITSTSTLPPKTVVQTEVLPGTTITSYSTVPAGPPQTIVITQTQPAATIVSTSYVKTPITSVSIYTEAPSTIYQTSTICQTHWATLTKTRYSTQYNTVTAAPSTITNLATLTINSVLTETRTVVKAPSTTTSTQYETISSIYTEVTTLTEAPSTYTDVRTRTIKVPITKVLTHFEAPSTITQYSTLPGSTAVVYSTIRSEFTSTIISVQPGRTVYETSISTKEGSTFTATLNSVETVTKTTCSIPIGPVTAPPVVTVTRSLPGKTYTSFVTSSWAIPVGPTTSTATITLTRTFPGATFTSFYTAPGYNHSFVHTSVVTSTAPGSTILHTAPGDRTTLTEYRTTTLPGSTFTATGGKVTLTEYATRTLPGSITTSIVNKPGEHSTITSTETTTCYETVSSCSATPTWHTSPPRETTIYATYYLTKTLPLTYTAHETCSDSTITVTASSGGWDKPGDHGAHGSHAGDWNEKPSSYGEAAASSSEGSWRRA